MRLLLIEDDETISRELALRWRSRGWAVAACATLAQGRAAQADGGYDVVVLDRTLPDGDGLEWLHSLRKSDRQTPVLMLSAMDRVADRVMGLHGGADDYLVKPFAVEELDARIEALARASAHARGEMLQVATLSWLGSTGVVLVQGRQLELSRREFEVLGLLMRTSPRVLRKQTLSAALAERNMEVGEAATEVYVSRLRRRLEGCGVHILTVRGLGYRLVPQDDAQASAPLQQLDAGGPAPAQPPRPVRRPA